MTSPKEWLKRFNGIKTRAGSRLGFSLLIFLSLTSCREKFDQLGVSITLEKHQLSNGLQVILVEDHTVPIITYQSWFRVGSVDEKYGMTGISHLFEHLMFKGTDKYGPKQFFFQLEAKGAEVNAFTTRDYTAYYEDFTPDLLEKVIDMESDRLANLKLDDEVLMTERQVVLEERRLRTENDPSGKVQEALWELAYRYHPYQWPVIGYPKDLLGLKLPQVVSYFQDHYQPANAALVVVGDIDPVKTLAMIKKSYETIPARPVPSRDIPNEPEQKEERRLLLHDQVASERFDQAYHVTSATEEDSYALDVLASIVFEGDSSRAYRRLVEEKDILTGISGTAFTPTFRGLFLITANMKGSIPASEGEAALADVIQEVQTHGVTQAEVAMAVKKLTVQMVDSVRTPHGLGQLLGVVQTILGDPRRFVDDLSKYLKVTPADVQRVAQVYLIPNNRSVVTMSPEKKASK